MEMMELLGYSALSLLLIKYFTPIQPAREWVITKGISFMIKYNLYWLHYLWVVLSCPFCFSTWFTLALTLNVWDAAIVGILTKILMLIIDKLEDVRSLE